MTMPKSHAEALAAVVMAVRSNHPPAANAAPWDYPGVIAAIAKVRERPLADVALAAIRAADTADLDTPAAIGNPQTAAWRERNTDRPTRPEPFDPAAACGTCGQTEAACMRNPHAGHEYEPLTAVYRRRTHRKPGSWV